MAKNKLKRTLLIVFLVCLKLFVTLAPIVWLTIELSPHYPKPPQAGVYKSEYEDKWGELTLTEISEEEFLLHNGKNVFRYDYKRKAHFYLIEAHATVNGTQIELEFFNLEFWRNGNLCWFVDDVNSGIDPFQSNSCLVFYCNYEPNFSLEFHLTAANQSNG
ncbi:MAG: hypothetical protein ACI4QL_00270 [Candidatus Fimimonas sp.]